MRVSSPTVWISTLPCDGCVISSPAPNGLPPLLTMMPHQPPSLPTLTGASAVLPAAGASFGAWHFFAPPDRSAWNRRADEAGGGCAHPCNSAVRASTGANSHGRIGGGPP